jgi:hypothetical protein
MMIGSVEQRALSRKTQRDFSEHGEKRNTRRGVRRKEHSTHVKLVLVAEVGGIDGPRTIVTRGGGVAAADAVGA